MFLHKSDNIKLRDCLKCACVQFEASKSSRENSVGGGTLSVLKDRLDKSMEIDKVNITYELMHPKTRKKTSDSLVYLSEPLEFISEDLLTKFTKLIKTILDTAKIEYEFKCKSYKDHPGYGPLTRGPDLPADGGNPITTIEVSFNIKDAENIAIALEQAGFHKIPNNEEIASDIRKALDQIQEHTNRISIKS